jgi:hypothetical protein
MAEEAPKQRFRNAKKRTFKSLRSLNKYVIPVPSPTHYFCPRINTFIRVEIDELQEAVKEDLHEFKNHCSSAISIQVHLYTKHAKKPEIIEINGK